MTIQPSVNRSNRISTHHEPAPSPTEVPPLPPELPLPGIGPMEPPPLESPVPVPEPSVTQPPVASRLH